MIFSVLPLLYQKHPRKNFFLDFTDIFLTFIVIDSSKATFGKTFSNLLFFYYKRWREAGNSASGTKYSIAYRIKTCIRRPKDGVNKSSSFF